jgi:hypothetical protein
VATEPRDRMTKLRGTAANLGLAVLSLCLSLSVCEFVAFRFIWVASDAPANDFVDGVVRYAPNQRGVWRVGNEIAAPYRINMQGWNSGSGDYAEPRRSGVPRLAVVGDSYVEALQVPYDRSFAELLAGDLGSGGDKPEAYRFAISGAPLSQSLLMLEREVAHYRPDWIIVLVNDFDLTMSYRLQAGRYTSSFLKLRVADGRVVGESPPQPWRPNWRDWLRRTATARYFLYRWRVRPEALIHWLLPPAQAAAGQPPEADDIAAATADGPTLEAVTDYLYERLAGAARAIDARLLLVIDADREAIYRGTSPSPGSTNPLATAIAARHEIPFVDLGPAFAASWAADHRRFEFAADYHWNEYGHVVAAAAIAAALRAEGWP